MAPATASPPPMEITRKITGKPNRYRRNRVRAQTPHPERIGELIDRLQQIGADDGQRQRQQSAKDRPLGQVPTASARRIPIRLLF